MQNFISCNHGNRLNTFYRKDILSSETYLTLAGISKLHDNTEIAQFRTRDAFPYGIRHTPL